MSDQGWFYATDGRSIGPVTVEAVRVLVGSGELSQQHSVRHATWDRWVTVEQAASRLGLSAGGQLVAPPPPAASSSDVEASSIRGAVNAGQRVTSWAIDTVALVTCAVALNAMFPSVLAAPLLFVAFAAYTVWLPLRGYARLGHVVVGLRITRIADDEGPPDLLALVSRSATFLILAAPCLVGVVCSTISMFAHDKARAWHDVASGTTLVKVRAWDFSRAVRPT